MSLKLAVQITGDASGLRQATEEATRAVAPLTSAVEAASGRTATLSSEIDKTSAASRMAAGAQSQAAAAVAGGAGAISNSARAHAAHGQAANLNRVQLLELGHVAKATVEQLAAGAPVMTLLAQQGASVAQALSMGQGGVGGSLRALGGSISSLVNPATAATAGIALIAAGAAFLGLRWASTEKEIRLGLAGIGVLSRATVGDIVRIGEAASTSGRLSAGSAREIATGLASTGRVDVSNIPGIVGLAPGYSKLFGKDLSETGSDLARIFADPVKGAAELDARLGSLDDRTQRYIRSLVEQGHRQEAIRVMVQAFAPDLDRVVEKTSLWAKAWAAVSGAADKVGEKVSATFIVPATVDQRLADAERRLREVQASPLQTMTPPTFEKPGGFGLPSFGGSAKILVPNPSSVASGTGQREIVDQQAIVDRLRQEQEQARALEQQRQREAELADRSKRVGETARSLQPEIDQLETYKNKIEELSGAVNDVDLLKKLGPSADQVRRAFDLARGAVESFLSVEEKARSSEALSIRSILARTDAEKAAIAAEQKRIELAGQTITAEDRRTRINAASAVVLTQGLRESQDRLRSANDNSASASLLPYQRQVAELDAKYREIFRSRQGNTTALATDQAAKAAERSAIDQQAIGNPIRDANLRVQEQIAGLRVQQESFGASTEAAARLAAAQQLVNKYTADGVRITPDLKRQIDDVAAATGRAAAADEDLARKQRQVVGALDDIRSGTKSAATGIFTDLLQRKNPLEGLKNAATGIAGRVFDRTISAPLTENLLGQDGKAGGGLFGGALASIFGKQAGISQIGTATITAGIVNVTGGVSPTAAAATTGSLGTPSAASVAGDPSRGAVATPSSDLPTYRPGRAPGDPYPQGGDPVSDGAIVQSGFVPKFYFPPAGTDAAETISSGGKALNRLPGADTGLTPDALQGSEPFKRLQQSFDEGDGAISRSFASASTSIESGGDGIGGALKSITTLLTGGSPGGSFSLAGLADSGGGAAQALASGGPVRGLGTGTSDSVLIRASHGEFVINAAATARHLPLLHDLNAHRMPAFAEGGLISAGPGPVTARRDTSVGQSGTGGNGAADGTPVINSTVHNYGGGQVDAKATRGPNGEVNLETTIRHVDAALAKRAARGQGALSQVIGSGSNPAHLVG